MEQSIQALKIEVDRLLEQLEAYNKPEGPTRLKYVLKAQILARTELISNTVEALVRDAY